MTGSPPSTHTPFGTGEFHRAFFPRALCIRLGRGQSQSQRPGHGRRRTRIHEPAAQHMRMRRPLSSSRNPAASHPGRHPTEGFHMAPPLRPPELYRGRRRLPAVLVYLQFAQAQALARQRRAHLQAAADFSPASSCDLRTLTPAPHGDTYYTYYTYVLAGRARVAPPQAAS
ncbi:hypothetical protein C8Q79DRAFT_117781 [Trametes meyenii]|nr:hypothetical protein C8Q79DRAFT_117781 [Trametes meyenii]